MHVKQKWRKPPREVLKVSSDALFKLESEDGGWEYSIIVFAILMVMLCQQAGLPNQYDEIVPC